jgi:hypothetical protein
MNELFIYLYIILINKFDVLIKRINTKKCKQTIWQHNQL